MGFLSNLTGGGGAMPPAMAQPTQPTMPQSEFGVPDMMGGINQSLAQNQQMGQQRKPGGGFKNVLGMIGDALLVHSGRAPIYAPAMQKRRVGQALQNYLGQMEPGMAEIFAEAPEVGFQLYKMKHPEAGVAPETIRLMQAAGIDPKSPEGQALIKQHLNKGGGQSDPTFVRELEAMGIDPGSDEARELYYGRNSPAGYLLKPRPRGGASAASTGPMPTFSTPEEAKASGLPPGTQFKAPNGRVYSIPGGATGNPSATFPGQ